MNYQEIHLKSDRHMKLDMLVRPLEMPNLHIPSEQLLRVIH